MFYVLLPDQITRDGTLRRLNEEGVNADVSLCAAAQFIDGLEDRGVCVQTAQ